MTARFNPSRNPATNKKWLLRDLLIETQQMDQRLSKLESATNLEYSWSRICKEARVLIQKQIAEETKSIWSDLKRVNQSEALRFELINHPRK